MLPQGEQLSKAGAVKAFRCQLPRSNEFYGAQPPAAADKYPPPLPPAAPQVRLSRLA